MPYIILAGQYFRGQKMPECGMQWGVAIKKLGRQLRPINATRGLSAQKIDKESQYIRWPNYITQWDPSSNKRQWTHSRRI